MNLQPDELSMSLPIVSSATVSASINLLSPDFPRSSKPVYSAIKDVPAGMPQPNTVRVAREVQIHDVRGAESSLALDVTGFEIVQHQTCVPYDGFSDQSTITDMYYPECEQ